MAKRPEQSALRAGVVIEIPMVIKVFPRDVRDHGDVERNAPEPSLVEPVRGTFNNDVVTPGADHVREKFRQVPRSGSCELARIRPDTRAYLKVNGGNRSHGVPRGFDRFHDEVNGGCFSVGSGHPDNAEFSPWKPKNDLGDDCLCRFPNTEKFALDEPHGVVAYRVFRDFPSRFT